jgi:hypothetical protein
MDRMKECLYKIEEHLEFQKDRDLNKIPVGVKEVTVVLGLVNETKGILASIIIENESVQNELIHKTKKLEEYSQVMDGIYTTEITQLRAIVKWVDYDLKHETGKLHGLHNYDVSGKRIQ